MKQHLNSIKDLTLIILLVFSQLHFLIIFQILLKFNTVNYISV